ncbi:hypothetical protein DAETH_32400 (plasmid) [Deinococcus aetherius]|uniref:Uncharacterized protein n=1 Tax=Deinococcus aetherius TaxID=200252 RepID=A0ABM8AHT2_9DEIO|nr:hypothetical protein [Deinococcus aetherius]BDP43271.1 hypothetical protein DAETH_32400 [Deinococcus aetherius]
MIDRANANTTAIEDVPLPRHDYRTYLDGPLDERLARLVTRLSQEHRPGRGVPQLLVAPDDQVLRAVCSVLRVAYDDARVTTTFYVWPAHAIVVTPGLTAMLNHPDVRSRLCGLRFLLHEWWHALRTDRQRVYGLEEGGAELFADRMLETLTGVDGSLRRIQVYRGLVTGVLRLGERRRGTGAALAWAWESRTTPDVKAWLTGELTALGVNHPDIAPIIGYSETTGGSWAQLVEQALPGR